MLHTLQTADHSRYAEGMDIDAMIEKAKAYVAVALFLWAGATGGSPAFLIGTVAAFYLGYRLHRDFS